MIDNLDNAFEAAYERMKKLAGAKAGNMKFIKARAACLFIAPLSHRLMTRHPACRQTCATLTTWTRRLPTTSARQPCCYAGAL